MRCLNPSKNFIYAIVFIILMGNLSFALSRRMRNIENTWKEKVVKEKIRQSEDENNFFKEKFTTALNTQTNPVKEFLKSLKEVNQGGEKNMDMQEKVSSIHGLFNNNLPVIQELPKSFFLDQLSEKWEEKVPEFSPSIATDEAGNIYLVYLPHHISATKYTLLTMTGTVGQALLK